MSARTIERLVTSHPSQDGDGVKISRIHDFGGGLDPFLMLDELGSDQPDDYIGGFPPHPHRGIETLTYVIHGGLTHEDHLGHRSTIGAGDAQWMHTGHGIIHSEMPLTDSQGLHAFQLWINLPARDKLSPATYRDIRHAQMPRLETQGAALVALGGDWSTSSQRISGPLDALAGESGIAHVTLEPGASLTLETAAPTLLVYVFEGEMQVAGSPIGSQRLARLSGGDTLTLDSRHGGQALLLAGHPHHEPIAHYGPFVMNHREELDQALRDYRDGTFAEKAH
ncbi:MULTISPECIES: pirin family protein [unclassified Modicisalibacter]|uniref:pirin family protein n=2 Tax=Modicisalibacter TaxID=574347 RepID=UPI001CCA9196|nr:MULTISPECIES: pirin family protein [unclassified Modicisalibacter]MBZ9560170.1 pirin family protein [Modicisalibacter sp. R2A 31.J]MBZ9576078.1 pirin family protein [Modicisalibacter sp. MOD 31.J]